MADITLSSILGDTPRLPSVTQIFARESGALQQAVVPAAYGGTFTASATPSEWVTVLDISSPGILFAAMVGQGNSTSKTVGLRITIDGVEACSVTRAVATTVVANGVVAGAVPSVQTANATESGFAPFQTLLIEANSSVASDTAAFWRAYYNLF